MSVPLIDLDILQSDFAQLERMGVSYGLGAKFPSAFLHDPTLPLTNISLLDCSGYIRGGLYRASKGGLLLPDGSQNQRAWAEQNLRQVAYRDAAAYMTDKRLFICFIKPNTNGCGDIAHVWLLQNADGDSHAQTMESHGGAGIDSRSWDCRVLLREVYSAFELKTVQGGV